MKSYDTPLMPSLCRFLVLCFALAAFVVPVAAAAPAPPPSGVEQYVEEIPTATGPGPATTTPGAGAATPPPATSPNPATTTGGDDTEGSQPPPTTETTPPATTTEPGTVTTTPVAMPGEDSESGDSNAVIWVLLGALGLGLILAATALSRRRRASSPPDTP